MKTPASAAFIGIAIASAVILSTPSKAASFHPGPNAVSAAALGAGLVRVADGRADDTLTLSARNHKKGGNKHARSNRGSHRSRHNNGAAIAAGVLGVIGGIIAADQANQAPPEEDYYYDEPPPPPPRYYRRHYCRYGVWIDRDGYEHCRH